ncbi:hypothetical protein BOTBODRAFT_111154, partial [Botryobasidium botryosum FD-172 SS1]
VFAHNDKKEGQQDTLQVHMEAEFGYRKRFPDTCNNQYHSYSGAATELITKHSFYCQFLELVHDLKDGQKWTNIEQNVYDSLRDTATLTELAVLTLDGQTCLTPFLLWICMVSQLSSNLCNLGPLMWEMCSQYKSIIQTGMLDGKPWDQPDVVYTVQSMATKLPELEGVFVAYCQGAARTWEQFTTEFAPGSTIDSALTVEQLQAFMMPTNDANKGALGEMWYMSRHVLNMTLEQLNVCKMYCKNNTAAFMCTCFEEEDHSNMRREARERKTGSAAKEVWVQQVAYDKSVQENVHKTAAKHSVDQLALETMCSKLTMHTDVEDIHRSPGGNDDLNNQLNFHHRIDHEVPFKLHTCNKDLKVAAFIAAVEWTDLSAQWLTRVRKICSGGHTKERDWC